jgi:hypothetical protein
MQRAARIRISRHRADDSSINHLSQCGGQAATQGLKDAYGQHCLTHFQVEPMLQPGRTRGQEGSMVLGQEQADRIRYSP